MNKEKSPILVLGCILILSIFIILPPVFRTYFPDNSSTINRQNTDKITVLMCSRYFVQELYKVTSNTKYKNNNIESNTIKYEKINQVPEGVTDINTNVTVNQEYLMLSTLKNVNIVNKVPLTIIEINQNLLNSNPDNQYLLNYFQTIENQKQFYESMGYNCNIAES